MATSGSRAAIVLLIVLLLGAGGWYAKESTSSCMIAVNNAEATMTISGIGSTGECEEIARQNPDRYVRQSPPDGGVLCEKQHGRKRYVVRDRGAFMIIGRSMCSSLDNRIANGR
jgi:hypothetical protein